MNRHSIHREMCRQDTLCEVRSECSAAAAVEQEDQAHAEAGGAPGKYAVDNGEVDMAGQGRCSGM